MSGDFIARGGPERRAASRDRSFARVLVSVEGVVGFIADVSERGFRGIFPERFELASGRLLSVEISFEEIGIDIFTLDACVRWVLPVEGGVEAGFELASLPVTERSAFNRIREYYAVAQA